MNRIVNAIQVDKKNISDIFKLPCVSAIHKYSEPAVFAYVSNRQHLELAWPGDWLCQLSDDKWLILTDKQYQTIKQNKTMYYIKLIRPNDSTPLYLGHPVNRQNLWWHEPKYAKPFTRQAAEAMKRKLKEGKERNSQIHIVPIEVKP
jgi:hypothetical protein